MTESLLREEQEIARKYLFNDTWIYVVWGISNFLIWISLWPIAFMNILPLWIIFIIATINCCLAYLPSHEAQHGNIVKTTLGVERIPDKMLLTEMMQYYPGLNVDRLVAFSALIAFAKLQQANRGYIKRKEEDNSKDSLEKSQKM